MIRTGSTLIKSCNEWFGNGKFELPPIKDTRDNFAECRLIFDFDDPFKMIFQSKDKHCKFVNLEGIKAALLANGKSEDVKNMMASRKHKCVENLMKCFKELLKVIIQVRLILPIFPLTN